MKRILCVWLPRWPIQRLRRMQPALRRRLVVLYIVTGRGKMQVACCSSTAHRAGIVPDMPLAEAKVLAPEAHFACLDPRADLEALRKLALWAHRFSPTVGVEELERPESILLDIT